MTEVVREIRKLTFDDRTQMDEVIETQRGWWSSKWAMKEPRDPSLSYIGFASNWHSVNAFDITDIGSDFFGMFENGELNYIKMNRYYNHSRFDRRMPDNVSPFSTSITISRKNKNVPRRLAADGKTNLNIIELQNYAIINGSEAVGCNVIMVANAGDPRPNESADIGNGKIWHFNSRYSGEEIQSRRSTHYHCVCLEEVLPEESSMYSWFRNCSLFSTHTHKTKIFMFVRHNFES